MANDLLTQRLAEPLNDTETALVDIDSEVGAVTIDRLAGGERLLVSAALQYFESQGPPTRTIRSREGQATFTVRGREAGRPWFRLPWAACKDAPDWQIHLNPTVASDITAHSGGGAVRLDLTGMTVTRVAAHTGAGNMDVVLPDDAANLNVAARTGAGNVTVAIGAGMHGAASVNANSGAGNVFVHVPRGVAARIHATNGLGKVMVDPRFRKIAGGAYQSPDFDSAVDKVEITAHSGAGNVTVDAG